LPKIVQHCVQKVFTGTPIDVVLFKFRENVVDGKWVKSCVVYLTKKFGCFSNCRYMRRSHTKSALASPQQCTHSAPDFIQIRLHSAEL